MRGKAPEDVFLSPYFPNVQPVGVEALNSAQCSVPNELLQFHNRRVIAEDVANHQDSLMFFSQLDQFLAVPDFNRQWLLHKNVLPGLQCRLGQFIVCHRRRG